MRHIETDNQERRSTRHWLAGLLLLCFGLFWCQSTITFGQATGSEASQKVQFIQYFAFLSQWPKEAFENSGQELIVGVLGDEDFDGHLGRLNGKKVNGRDIEVVRFSRQDEYGKAHVLFISDSERDALWDILIRLSGRYVMTIGDMDGFTERGGMIGFTTDGGDGKVRFKINQESARSHSIRIGLEMVKLGEVVQTEVFPECSKVLGRSSSIRCKREESSSGGPLRVAVFPSNRHAKVETNPVDAVFRSLRENDNITFTHAAEKDLATKLGIKHFESGDSFWERKRQNEHAKPDVETVRAVAKRLGVSAVLMYSTNQHNFYQGTITGGMSSSHGDYDLRIFLVDVATGQVYAANQVTHQGSLTVEKRDALVDQLFAEYLANRNKIRVAILPSSEPDFLSRSVQNDAPNIFASLKDNNGITVTHAANEQLAKEFGVQYLRDAAADRFWTESGRNTHPQLKLEAIEAKATQIQADTVLMFSIALTGTAQGNMRTLAYNDYGLRMHLVDVATGKVYTRDLEIRRENPRERVALATQLLDEYVADQNKIRVAILPSQQPSQMKRAVAQQAPAYFSSLKDNPKIKLTHAADGELAERLGALHHEASNDRRLWTNTKGKTHSQPKPNAVGAELETLGADLALMFSAIPSATQQISHSQSSTMHPGAGFDYRLRMYLVDVTNQRVYTRDLEVRREKDNQREKAALAKDLLDEYFAELNKVRVAILPSSQPSNLTKGMQHEAPGYFLSLKDREEIRVTHAPEEKLAKQFGAAPLNEAKGVWTRTGNNVHARPKLDAVEAQAKRLGADVVLMFSAIPSGWSAAPTHTSGMHPGIGVDYRLRMYIVDVRHRKIHSRDIEVRREKSNPRGKAALALQLLDDYFATSEATQLATAAPAQTFEATVTDQTTDDGPLRVAILPAHDRNQFAKDIARGLFLPLGDDDKTVVTHVADSRLTQPLGADLLEAGASGRERFWQMGSVYAHGRPRVDAAREFASGAGADVALMYSSTARQGLGEIQLFLIDVDTGELRTGEELHLPGDQNKNVSRDPEVNELAGRLIRDYLAQITAPPTRLSQADAGPIRVAVLPERITYPTWATGVYKGLLGPMQGDPKIEIRYAEDAKLAEQYDAEKVTLSAAERRNLWNKVGKTMLAGPNVEGVIQAVGNLGLDLVFMYELGQDGAGAAHPDLRVHLIDVDSKQAYQVARRLSGSAGGTDGSDQVSGITSELLRIYLADRSDTRPRVAILPARDTIKHTTWPGGVTEGLYSGLANHSSIRVTHVTDARLINDLEAIPIVLTPENERVWKPADFLEHPEPDLEATKGLVDGLGTDLVLMHSIYLTDDWNFHVRVFLIDLDNEAMFEIDKSVKWISFGDSQSKAVKGVTDELIQEYLTSRSDPRIRLAILPARQSKAVNISGLSRGIYGSLGSNESVRALYATDREIAKRLGAEVLDIEGDGKLWKPGARLHHTEPDVAAVQKATEGLNIDAVLMHSFPPGPDFGGGLGADGVRVYLVDLRTDSIYQVDQELVFEAGGDYSRQVAGMADRLLADYMNGAKEVKESSSQPTTTNRITSKNQQ